MPVRYFRLLILSVALCSFNLRLAAAGDIVFWDDPTANKIFNTAQAPAVVTLSSGQMTLSDAGLAVDRLGAMYVGYTPTSGPTGVLKISPDGQSQSMLATIADPTFLAVDLGGDVYVAGRWQRHRANFTPRVGEFV